MNSGTISTEDFYIIEQAISHHLPIIGFQPGVYSNGKSTGSYFIVEDYNPESFKSLVSELDENGFIPYINHLDNYYKINIVRKPESTKSNIHYNIILFIVTVCTTLFAGYILGQGDIWKAVAFAMALLGIIGAHESAHYFAARKHGVSATLPYFIPGFPPIGTFGALINVRSPIPTRKALFDLGYSGPLAGFLVAIPVLLVGLKYSTVTASTDLALTFIPPPLMELFTQLVAPTVNPDQMLIVHPVAFAGWVGIIVTMLNLMPVAFLDGGHISRSLFTQNTHKIVSIIGIVITIALGWHVMAALMLFMFLMGKGHPGALDNINPINRNRKIIAVLILIIFILCLSPAPITQT